MRSDPSGSFVEQARRAQIIEATVEVLAEHGYAAASFAKIAERAAISPGLINYHFRTKDALMAGVLATLEQRLDAAMAGPEDEEPASYPEALAGMLRRFTEYCWTHGAEITAMTGLRRARSESLRAAVADTHQRGNAELTAFIAEGQSHHQFRALDPAVFAAVLMSAMGEFPRLRGRDEAEHRRVAADWVSLFTHGISVPGSHF